MPQIKQQITETIVNEHGELVERKTNQTLSWGAEPPFIKLYLQDVLYLTDIPKSHENILFELLKRATYAGDENGMTVTLSSGLKRMIAKTLDIKNVRSINNALSELVKGQILFRLDTGIYQFNPYFFGKGDWQDISKLRLEINYDAIKGKTFRAVIESVDQKKKELEAADQNKLEVVDQNKKELEANQNQKSA